MRLRIVCVGGIKGRFLSISDVATINSPIRSEDKRVHLRGFDRSQLLPRFVLECLNSIRLSDKVCPSGSTSIT